MSDNFSDTLVDVAKDAPLVVVTGFSLFGFTLQEWVYLLTIVYTVMRIVEFVYRLIVKWLRKKDG